jgi:hypothetical protein
VYEQVSNRESVDNLYQLNMCSYVVEIQACDLLWKQCWKYEATILGYS